MIKTPANPLIPGESDLMVARLDAQAAAEAVATLASGAARWAALAEAGSDDATEAAHGSIRARLAADRAQHCTGTEAAWSCAHEAWAAVSSVAEASARVNAAIVEELLAA